MATAGSIVIDLIARTGSFETDTKRAEKRLLEFKKEAIKVGKAVGLAFSGALIGSAALVKSSIDAQDEMIKLAQSVGQTVEELSALAYAADLSGVSQEQLGSAMVKLNKNISDAGAGLGEAKRGFDALGISVRNADGSLKSSGVVIEELAEKFSKAADSTEKTALAVSAFGKSGAALIPLLNSGADGLKQMADEAAELGVVFDTQTAKSAEVFNDNLTRISASIKGLTNTATKVLLPALNAVADEMLQLAKSEEFVATATGIIEGAISTAVVVFQTLAVVASDVGFVFLSVGREIGAWAAQISALASGDLDGFTAISDAVKEDGKRARAELDAFQARILAIGQPKPDLSGFAKTASSFGGGTTAFKLPSIQEKPDKSQKDKTTEADKYIESLQKQIQKTQELTEVERVLDDIVNGRFEGAKAGQAFQALALADEIDRTNQLAESTKKLVDEAERMEDASNRLRDAGKAVFDQTRTPAEQYATELTRINGLLQAGAINADTYERAVTQLQDQFDENAQRIKAIAQTINASVEGGFVDAFAGFIDGSLSAGEAFSRFARGVISDMARIAAQDLAKSLFSSGSNGAGGIGGLLASLFGASTTGLGSASVNDPYSVPMATGTNVVPYDGFRATLHKGEAVVPAKYNPAAGGSSGGSIQVINPPGVPLQAQAREERQPDGSTLRKIILSVMQDDVRTGGPYSQTQASTFGLKRQLPRMGR